ncbi:unnamed protein product, partial [Laminaria digitata]
NILHRCTSPREAWDALLEWYGPQTTGAKSDLSRRLNSFKIATGSNPQAEIGKIEDLPAKMRSAGMILDDDMLYTISLDALPSEYDIESRNLASRDSVSREESIKAVRERHRRLSGNGKKGGTNEGGGASAAAAGGDGKSAKAAEGNYPRWGCYRCGKKGPVAADCRTRLCERCNGRRHTADVCPAAKEEAVLAVMSEVEAGVDDDDD